MFPPPSPFADAEVGSMGYIEDSIRVDAPPERVWSWLSDLAQHYLEWHPGHVSAEWVRGQPNRVGSVLRAVEDLGGHREVLRFEMTRVEPPHRMAYRVRGAHSIVLPGGAFVVSPDDGGSTFTARLHYRFGAVTEMLFRRRITVLRAHMREEGENLKRLIETGG
jgi:uncharacterized protein YndB with AHSA1/START domain